MNLIDRSRAYLAKLPPAIAGQRGHTSTFGVACKLVHGFDLSPSDALPLLMEWNLGCQPPWTESELRHKLADADKVQSRHGRGYLLNKSESAAHFRPPTAPAPEPRPLPDRTGFGPGTREQIQRLADTRPYHREGLEWANERGVLVFGAWRGFDCYGVTDASGRVVELRRMDGKPFPAVVGTALGERKSHALRGSQKAWPLGILEAREFPAVALVEGLPDFLVGHYVALWEQASHYSRRDARCAPVAMLSASPAIHADALPHFKGKSVRIFPHSEGAGLKGAAKWQAQLQAAGAERVDVFDLSAYRKADGATVNDLWEFVHHLHADDQQNPVTWRIMP